MGYKRVESEGSERVLGPLGSLKGDYQGAIRVSSSGVLWFGVTLLLQGIRNLLLFRPVAALS